MEAHMRIICVAFTGLVALAAVPAQSPNPNQQNWHPLGPAVTFGLGDQVWGRLASGSLARLARFGGGVHAFRPGDFSADWQTPRWFGRLKPLGSGLLSSVARR